MRARYVVRIGPGDVGRRVSIRARIPAEPHGPRHRDTLGVLRAWTGGILEVERRDGSLARISEVDVVAARLVPEPPRRASQ